jgi:hypothetical protein
MAIDAVLNKATPQAFELVFPRIPTETELSANQELTLNIHSTVIPGVNIDLIERNWMGGISTMPGGRIDFNPWEVSFLVDSDFTNWYMLYNWLMHIHNNKDLYAVNPGDIWVDATLRIINNFSNDIMRIIFHDVWISSLSDVTMSYRDESTYLEGQATFYYGRYEASIV